MINDSCNNRGCEYNRILPNDGRIKSFRSRMFQKRNDFKAVVSFPNVELHKMAQKKRQMEKSNIKAFRSVHLLSNGLDSHNLLRGDLYESGFVNAAEYRSNFYNS